MNGYLNKEDWLIDFEDKERDLYNRKQKLKKEISELDFKWAQTIRSDPRAAAEYKASAEEGKRLIREIEKEAENAAKPFESIRPKFCDSTVMSFCAVLAFVLTLPDMMYETISAKLIGRWAVLWLGSFIFSFLGFNIVNAALKAAQKPTKHRKVKTILIDIFICAVCALIYSYFD